MPSVKKHLELNSSNQDIDSCTLHNLLCGLETKNQDLIGTGLSCNDIDIIRTTVKDFPKQHLKLLLEELYVRLKQEERHVSAIASKWLKEILSQHLTYIRETPEIVTALDPIKEHIEGKRVYETVSKMHKLRGLLNAFQIPDSDESSSENEEDMET